MSKALGKRCVWGLCGVLVSVLASASVTRAEVSTDVSGSVLVFPKVLYGPFNAASESDPSLIRDTVIQIANTSNNMVHAHCFYVNAEVLNGTPIWQVTDFTIWLTRQQPTHWVLSEGRSVDPSDSPGSDGAGLDPGAIPPVPEGFEGELKCVQVDASDTPFGGNNLKGEALLRSATGDVSKANAVAILANPDLVPGDPPDVLTLDNSPLHDGEYNACPNTWLLDHFVDGATNPVITEFNPTWCEGGECPIRTYLTLVPCTEDFENDTPAKVTVQFAITNEFEQSFSASTSVTCYLTTRLADITAPTGTCSRDGDVCISDQQCIDSNDGFCEKSSVFSLGTLGGGTAFTQITPVALDGGVLTVAEEEHFNNKTIAAAQVTHGAYAAWNPQFTGNRYDATDPNNPANPNPAQLQGGPVIDLITIPQDF